MNRFIRISIVLLGALALPTLAQAADIFLLVQGVAGDSTAKGHEKWLRVSSLDWEIEAESSWTKGGGASVGKPNPGKIELAMPTGTWSQHFARLITQGKALPTIVVDALASDGRPLYRATMDGVFVTKFRLATLPATPLPQDTIEAVFKKVKIEYYATGADGRLVTTFVEWDIPAGLSSPTL